MITRRGLPLTGGTLTGALSMGNNPFDAGVITANGRFAIASAARFQGPADGVITLTNNAGTDFSRLQFGGTTSSFPALKRSSTTLAVRLADDSADAPISASTLTLTGMTVDASGNVFSSGSYNINNQVAINAGVSGLVLTRALGIFGFSANTTVTGAADSGLSRISAGIIGVGTGGQGSTAGTLRAAALAANGSDFTITAANSVSPTSPNRTITITYGGTTYYLAAKTTND